MSEVSSTHLVLIPSYDPGPGAVDTVRAARRAWNPVWVVVDGSRDGSAERLQSLAADARPVRITETPSWKALHREIALAMWEHPAVTGRFNCDACHRDAGEGGFMNGAMFLPH